MTKILAGIAALTMMGAATLPLPASAAEHGASKAQSSELSSQRHWRGHHHWRGHRGYYAHRYWGPRRHWGPRYGYYGPRYGYPYGYSYGYGPGLAFGFGPFGVRIF